MNALQLMRQREMGKNTGDEAVVLAVLRKE
jgi:hypothetical protein